MLTLLHYTFLANDCSLAARLKVFDLTLLAVMWSHIMLLTAK